MNIDKPTGRIGSSFGVGFPQLYRESNCHMLSSWMEKSFVISVSKCLFPFWASAVWGAASWGLRGPSQLRLWICVQHVLSSPPLASQLWQEVLGWEVMESCQACFFLALPSLLFITQEKAESQGQASWVLMTWWCPSALEEGQVTILVKAVSVSIPCFLPSCTSLKHYSYNHNEKIKLLKLCS